MRSLEVREDSAMKRHLFRLLITMLALGSGTAFSSTPGHVTLTKPMPNEAAMNSHETPPQTASSPALKRSGKRP